jgi:serine phosphatase RsbU (regulator of sigma subunit)
MKHLFFRAIAFGLLLMLLLGIEQSYSQEGNPFLSHFKIPSGVSNQNWGFEQGNNGLMYILNRKGVYSFDGLHWENLGVSGRPIAIAFSEKLFFCSDKGVGYFHANDDGELTQNIILESNENNIFYKFTRIPEGLLVVSPQTICKINVGSIVSVDTLYHEVRPEVFISDFFQINEATYHVKNRALVYLNKPDGGHEMLAGIPLGEDMTFSFIHNKQAFFGSTANKLYRFDGKKFIQFIIKDQRYINASLLNGGISVNEKAFALSTLNGGVLLINATDGSTLNTLNFFNGLPDDEIYSLGLDRDGGLWISHGMGITRADLKIPIRAYGYYAGLRGSILSCIEFEGSIYVGCSEGLFKLSEMRDYREVEVAIKQQAVETRTEPQVEQPKVDPGETVEEKKKGFISRLFTRKSTKTSKEDLASQPTAETRQQPDEKDLPPIKRKIYQLQSVSHAYKQITAVQGKVRNMIINNGTLFAATNFGLYEIKGDRVERMIANKNVVFVEGSRADQNMLLIGADDGAYLATKSAGKWTLVQLIKVDNQLVTSIVEIEKGHYIVSTEFDVFHISRNENNQYQSKTILLPGAEFGSPVIRWVNGKIKAYTSNSTFVFNPQTLEMQIDDSDELAKPFQVNFYQKGFTWFSHKNLWKCHLSDGDEAASESQFMGLLNNPSSVYVSDNGKLFVVNDYNQVYILPLGQSEAADRPISLFLKQITGKYGIQLDPSDIKLDYSSNSLTIRICAPSYLKEGSVQFQYIINGLRDSWSEWSSDPNMEFPYFPSGKYTISIRAKDILGNISSTLDIPFHIKPPFWQTVWFFALCFIAVVALFILTVKFRERSLRREKEILEQKVKERTKTIEEQKEVLKKQRDDLAKYNEEILQQKEEIEAQRDEIEAQRDQIFKQNDEITKSITYARRIQSAVMPSRDVIKGLLDNHFMIFRPRDIVSGDFYWMAERSGKVIVVAADCTGHGVPGAFMSMMGVSFLNDIINVAGVIQPDHILNELRAKIKTTLWQTGKEGETRDGMDIAVCVFDSGGKQVQYAGAYNPLYLIRNGELIEYKADKMPVGIHIKEKETFTLHEIELKSGDNLYIFSDGYVSQFGGPDGKKFMARPFKDLLVNINGKKMDEQQLVLEDALDKWQAAYDQVDDILVIGIEIG